MTLPAQTLSLIGLKIDESFNRFESRIKDITTRICKLYKVSDHSDVILIRQAERDLAACNECSGELCRKLHNQYHIPVIKKDDAGILSVAAAPCRYKVNLTIRSECGRVQIPLKYAGKTFDDYLVTPVNDHAVKIARLFCQRKPGQGLYLFGDCGTGKTFLAALIAKEFLRDGKHVIFGDVPALLKEIKRTFDGKGDAAEVLDRYCDCDLLVLDDLGAGQITDWNVGQLYQIINSRYNDNKSTVVTSNLDLKSLTDKLSIRDKNGNIIDDFAAKRICSRLSEMCTLLFLGTDDRRGKL